MNVLEVISSVNPKAGGPISGLMSTRPLLINMGLETKLVSLDDPHADHVKKFEYALTCFGDAKLVYGYSKKLSVWLDEHISTFDAVIIHGIWQFHSYATAKACLKYGVPYVIYTHGMLDPWFNTQGFSKWLKKIVYWKLFETKTIMGATRVLFTGEIEKEVSATSFKPYKARAEVVAFGSQKPKISRDTALNSFYQQYPALINQKFMLYLSRIHPKKGVDVLIKALALVLEKYPDTHIVIAGPSEPSYLIKLKALADQYKLQDHITWIDMITGEKKWGAFMAADCFVLPSHQENFGIVVSESLSVGTPVLISNKVHIHREVEEFKAGLVSDDNPQDFARICKLWLGMSESEKKIFSESSVSTFESKFTIEKAAANLFRIVSQLDEK